MLKKLLYIFLVICTMRACGTAGGLDTKFFNPTGSFGGAPNLPGLITTDFVAESNDVAYSVAIQADGKIVAVGHSDVGIPDFALARYNTNGSLDLTFNGTGKVTTDFGGTFDVANAVVIQTDGRIIAVGQSGVAGPADFALARYNTDGSLDPTFGTGGKVTTGFVIGSNDVAYSVAIQADGKIIAVGQSGNSVTDDFALARYNTDGSLDNSFDGDGKVTTSFVVGSYDVADSVAIQTDGRIVAIGQSDVAGIPDFALARYNTDGSLDLTFNGTGKVTTDFGGTFDVANAVVIQTDGRIIAVGQSNDDFALARYNTDGGLDFSFNGTGKVTTDFGGDPAQALAGALQADGRIVAVGSIWIDDGDLGDFDFAVARYNADGSLDLTFNGTGKVTTDFGDPEDAAFAVSLQTDGRIVAVGQSNNDFALARYLANVPSISTTLTIARIV